MPTDLASYLPANVAAMLGQQGIASPFGQGVPGVGTAMVGAPPAPPGGAAITSIPAAGGNPPVDINALIANAQANAGITRGPGQPMTNGIGGAARPGGEGGLGNRPQFGQYVPEGILRMLQRLMTSNPQVLEQMLGREGFANLLGRWGITPEMIQAEGFDPMSIYSRQDARQDWRSGGTVQAPGYIIPAAAPAAAAPAAAPIDPVTAAQTSGLGGGGGTPQQTMPALKQPMPVPPGGGMGSGTSDPRYAKARALAGTDSNWALNTTNQPFSPFERPPGF